MLSVAWRVDRCRRRPISCLVQLVVLHVQTDRRRRGAAPARRRPGLALRLFQILHGLVLVGLVRALLVVRPDHAAQRVQRYPVEAQRFYFRRHWKKEKRKDKQHKKIPVKVVVLLRYRLIVVCTVISPLGSSWSSNDGQIVNTGRTDYSLYTD